MFRLRLSDTIIFDNINIFSSGYIVGIIFKHYHALFLNFYSFMYFTFNIIFIIVTFNSGSFAMMYSPKLKLGLSSHFYFGLLVSLRDSTLLVFAFMPG